MDTNDLISRGKEIAAHKQDFTLLPEAWRAYNEEHSCEWNQKPLKKENKSNIPNKSGVYNLIVEPNIACHPSCGYLMYVGETKDLQRRFSEYLLEVDEEKGRPMIRKLLFMWKGFVKFYYIKVCQERKEEVQDSMINAFRPPYNIAMDASVGQPQKAFGP